MVDRLMVGTGEKPGGHLPPVIGIMVVMPENTEMQNGGCTVTVTVWGTKVVRWNGTQRRAVDESESPPDIGYAVSRVPVVDTSSPLVAKILEATTFEAYSRIFEEEEKEQPKTSRPIPRMSRTQWMGAMIGVAVMVVIVGIGMTVPRLVRRNHAVDQIPAPAVGKGLMAGLLCPCVLVLVGGTAQ